MRSRRALIAGVATVAGAAGVGAAVWRVRHDAPDPVAGLWSQPFDRPDGGRLTLAGFRGRPLLLNFWATWCPPCVSEMPLLDRFQRDQASGGWQVAGLAVDNLAPVNEFLGKRPVSYPIGLAGAGGIQWARELGNSGGALPFSVVFGRDGKVAQRKLGVIAETDLISWVRLLG